jgi:hypothetical protein
VTPGIDVARVVIGGRRSSSRLVTRNAFMNPGRIAMPAMISQADTSPVSVDSWATHGKATTMEKAIHSRPALIANANLAPTGR